MKSATNSSDTSEKIPQPWYAGGLKFTCTQCGNCCGGAPGYVWVTSAEISAIAEHVGMPVTEFEKKHTRDGGRGLRSLRERKNKDCEFLRTDPDGKKRCGIYPVRPLQCRTWPFWQSNVQHESDWVLAARSCPGMNRGEHHPLPVIQAALLRNHQAGLRV